MGVYLVDNRLKLEKLSALMQNWGFKVDERHYLAFEGYLKQMLEKDRVLFVWNGPFVWAVLFYFITNDYESLYKKPMWKVQDDDPEGNTIYIDKMICRKYTKDLRDNLGRAIQERFPNAETLVYHRAPKDRCYKLKREIKYEPIPHTVP